MVEEQNHKKMPTNIQQHDLVGEMQIIKKKIIQELKRNGLKKMTVKKNR